MTTSEKLHAANIELKPKSELWFCRLISKFYPDFDNRWTTFVFPFVRVIGYPSYLTNNQALSRDIIIDHELVHVRQCDRLGLSGLMFLFLYFVFPFPVLFAYWRFKLEAEAYLVDISRGRLTTDEVVYILWTQYAWPWPKPLMRKWFVENV